MKRIEDLSKSEILALSDEGVNAYIDYECALGGIPLLPPCPVKPEVIKYEPDIITYVVAGYNFKTLEEATAINEAFHKTTPYRIQWNDKTLIPLGAYDEIKVTTDKAFTPEYYNTVKAEKTASDILTKQYETDMKEYAEAVKARKQLTDYVWGIVQDARDEQYKKDCYSREFKRYLLLADNNKEMALKFLIHTHSDVENIEGLKDELLQQ